MPANRGAGPDGGPPTQHPCQPQAPTLNTGGLLLGGGVLLLGPPPASRDCDFLSAAA